MMAEERISKLVEFDGFRMPTRKHSSKERSSVMNAVRAIWTNGRILPSEPVDWPEGSQLRVEPLIPSSEKFGLSDRKSVV